MKRFLFSISMPVFLAAWLGCGSEPGEMVSDTETTTGVDTSSSETMGSDTATDTGTGAETTTDEGTDSSTEASAPQYPELWYSSGQYLVYIELSANDGSVVQLVASPMEGLPIGQNCLTMLDDGSLVGARLSDADNLTYFYHVEDPPRDGSAAVYTELGVMPDNIMLEGLYTDCDGRLYGMDTGTDVGGSAGNRLLRFLGDFLAGDFEYQVVSDLSSAVVADIDDMGPGIDETGAITDNPGLAIDTGTIYGFDYVLGTGTAVASGGTWGIHALGGVLFADQVARIYLLSSAASLFELDPQTYAVSSVLVTGPATEGNYNGWSGLAGPLTDCESGFPPVY